MAVTVAVTVLVSEVLYESRRLGAFAGVSAASAGTKSASATSQELHSTDASMILLG